MNNHVSKQYNNSKTDCLNRIDFFCQKKKERILVSKGEKIRRDVVRPTPHILTPS